MRNFQYRLICSAIIGLCMLAQVLFWAPLTTAMSLPNETLTKAKLPGEDAPAGMTSEEWDQIIQQVDPYYGQQAYLKAQTPAEYDNFGYSVAISGDTLVVGAYWEDFGETILNAGAAYVFVRSGTTWTQQAKLIASNPDQHDNFGHSVAISGDAIVVGAPNEDSNGTGGQADNSLSTAGAAYVFERSGTTWTQKAYLKASTPASDVNFGCSVAIDRKTIVVGAYREDLAGTIANAGGAYVFVRGVSKWTPQAHLQADNAEAGDYFGYSVDIYGNQIVVGAWGKNGDAIYEGAAYFFWRNPSTGIWAQKDYLKASNAETYDYFGRSVAISGDTLVVGADGEDGNGMDGEGDNSASSAGAAYVFEHIGAGWTQQAYLKAANVEENDVFGGSVAISGDTIVVGATGEASNGSGPDNNDQPYAGAAYVFIRSMTGWVQQAYLKAFNAEEYDYFGLPVAIDGSTIVVGAYSEDGDGTGPENNDTKNAGAAYVFASYSTYLPLITR